MKPDFINLFPPFVLAYKISKCLNAPSENSIQIASFHYIGT